MSTEDPEYRSAIATLCPFDRTKEEREKRKAMRPLIDKIKRAIVMERPGEDMLAEMYFAGIWHGSEVLRQRDLPPPPEPRKVDYLLEPRRRRSPARKSPPHRI